MTPSSAKRYRDSRHRLLVDMHIPDWDAGFLENYDPAVIAQAARKAGADGVMLYFQSHVGLCYWPTRTGALHAAARDRDLAGEALAALRADGLPVCAYYSVNFNNRAWIDNPDWRLQPAAAATVGILPRERYGIVCLNAEGYRAFVQSQIAEICTYDVDALFFDMMWWNGVCRCPSCVSRYAREHDGAAIPSVVDWSDPAWTRFQAARERWLAEWTIELRDRVKAEKPEADVYHNFALAVSNWTRGISIASVAGHDFLGGDFYGDRAEQLLITRLMLNLSPNRPPEFMTTVATSLVEHTRLRPVPEMETKALAAAASNAAFLAICAVDPDGRLDDEAVDRIRAGFSAAAGFSRSADAAVEDVGLYFSDLSRFNPAAGPIPLEAAPAGSIPDYPHFDALAGACRALQRAHIPFGVLSAANIGELRRWPVIVLPNAIRMSEAECAAFRAYVAEGGRLYASRDTSLYDVHGGPRQNPGLGDLFGCRRTGAFDGRLVYVIDRRPDGTARPVSHWRSPDARTGTATVRAEDAETLAVIGLPYGYPAGGTVGDTHWSSIHSSPPWTTTDTPAILRRAVGSGMAVYSAADIEAVQSPDQEALFISLIRGLMPGPERVAVETHPSVWMTAFSRRDHDLLISLLAYPAEFPALPVPSARVRVKVPEGMVCAGVNSVPDGACPAWSNEGGRVTFEAGPLEPFRQFEVRFVAGKP